MARVLLLSATPSEDEAEVHRAPLAELGRSAERDRFQVHHITSDAEKADIILFVESYGGGWHFERVRRHPLARAYREKTFIFCANPFVIPFLPGIYTGVPRRWASRRTTAGFYLGCARNTFATFTPSTDDLPYLYSFVGSVLNAPVRRKLATLVHARGLFRDTSAEWARVLDQQLNPAQRAEYHCRYAQATKESKFVLCPRGLSASTIRLFETMEMGRVPVILSDEWVEPTGPAWEKFVIRLRESDYAQLPRILEEREQEAAAMGERARAEWLDWFSEEAAFHRAVEWCLTIKARRRLPERVGRWPAYLHYLRPFHFKRLVRRKTKEIVERPTPPL